MMKSSILIIILCSAIIKPENPVIFKGTGISYADKIMVMALAGIVNRDSARLYLRNIYETWSYKQNDEDWEYIYKTKGGAVFDSISSVSQLIDRFGNFIRGGVQYDFNRFYSNFSGQNFNWQAEYAAVIGGLTDRLPVTASMAATYNLTITDSVLVHDAFNTDTSRYVPTKLDNLSLSWNASGLSEEQRYFNIIDWGIKNLLPVCNPGSFYLRELTDFTVKQKMFQVNLAGTEDLNFNSLPEQKAEFLERILLYMQSQNPGNIFHIYGWMRPEPLTQWFATFNASFHETLLGNLSWHTSFPVQDTILQLKSAVDPDTVVLRDKHYIVFIGSEGDASNWVFGLQSGAWVSPGRGNTPFGWGINLHLLSLAPFAAKYYYETATTNDGFVSVTSPLGYAYPDLWTAAALPSGHDESRRLLQKFKLKEIYGYKHYAPSGLITYRGRTISNSFNFVKYGQFQKNIGADITFIFDPFLATQLPNVTYGSLLFNHVNDGTFYGDVTNIPAVVQRIKNALSGKSKPYFYLAGYQRMRHNNGAFINSPGSSDITPQKLDQLAQALYADPVIGNQIEIVTPQYFSALLRKKMGLTDISENDSYENPSFQLGSYPNPFNASAKIYILIPEGGIVSLDIFSAAGEKIKTVAAGYTEPGYHEYTFDSYGLSSGVYFIRLMCSGTVRYSKIVLMK